MKDIFIFSFNTNCWLVEITQLRWQNIDIKKIVIIGYELFTTKNEGRE